VIDAQRTMPRLRWPAIIACVALAVVVALLGGAVLPPIPAALASFFGLFVFGFLAGKLAAGAHTYHGAVVGVGFVICEALGIVPGASYGGDPVSETVAVIVSDALRIAVAAVGGWCARLWSSSDKDKAR
jgi:hypothetical protein